MSFKSVLEGIGHRLDEVLGSLVIGEDGIVAGQLRDLHHGAVRKSDPQHLERIGDNGGGRFVASRFERQKECHAESLQQ